LRSAIHSATSQRVIHPKLDKHFTYAKLIRIRNSSTFPRASPVEGFVWVTRNAGEVRTFD